MSHVTPNDNSFLKYLRKHVVQVVIRRFTNNIGELQWRGRFTVIASEYADFPIVYVVCDKQDAKRVVCLNSLYSKKR